MPGRLAGQVTRRRGGAELQRPTSLRFSIFRPELQRSAPCVRLSRVAVEAYIPLTATVHRPSQGTDRAQGPPVRYTGEATRGTHSPGRYPGIYRKNNCAPEPVSAPGTPKMGRWVYKRASAERETDGETVQGRSDTSKASGREFRREEKNWCRWDARAERRGYAWHLSASAEG